MLWGRLLRDSTFNAAKLFVPEPETPSAAPSASAYVVLRSAGRWSDVFRLSAGRDAVIGRSSSNQITVRSERASRRHARVFWDDGAWRIEDLGSRNGTLVNGRLIETAHSLGEGDVIEVAGYAITFSTRLDIGPSEPAAGDAAACATDDQITMAFDANSITDRRRFSRFLHEETAPPPEGNRGVGASRPLLRLAFSLAGSDSFQAAAEATLEAITAQVGLTSGGIYAWEPGSDSPPVERMPLLATRQTGERSYRRPPASLVGGVLVDDGQAILARNVAGDRELATENSRGEIDVDSLIIAPIRDSADHSLGVLHLTTSPPREPLATEELEFVVAAAEILGESLANLAQRRRLDRSLRQSRRQIAQLQEQLGDRVRIIGRSPAIDEVNRQIALVAATSTTVLIRGESGVGKELVASAIHHASSRREGPLVCLNCAALSPTLLESELFGHEKGAFTGATERKRGKVEVADGGTLMLDEIGEMDADLQAKFLRVLEGHPFERIGGHDPIRADVRVVAATNRDLQAMVRAGTFRQDLYYRLHVIEIVVPPLRSRGRDCLEIAEHFLRRFNGEMGRRIEGLTDAAKRRLLDYSWPGNIRELKNVIERAVVLNTKQVIDENDLALAPPVHGPAHRDGAPSESPEITLAELERRHIQRVLRHTDGNKSRAASILGIERSTLDRKLKRYAQ